jgi:hypothetical protein
MIYKYSIPLHENTTLEQQQEMLRGSKLNVLQANSKCNWNKLVAHAQSGNCTCNVGVIGEVNILSACVAGRNLKEEYDNSLKILHDYMHHTIFDR